MDIALISLIGLCIAIIVSGVSRLNVGILAMSLAWISGYYLAEMKISAIVAGFPLSLATMLFGVTFLFSQTEQNGTLSNLAARAIGLARGRRGVLPLLFFILPLILATIGPGNIAAVALIAPLAMAIAGRTGISAFLMTLMVANGANAGAFSPFAPTGVIANGLIARQGLTMEPWTQVYLPSLLAQSFIAVLGYLIFGGLRLWRGRPAGRAPPCAALAERPARLTTAQWTTVGAIAALIAGVVLFKADLGFLAITLAVALLVIGVADQEAALKAVSWDTIIMVCGVSVLVAIVEQTGGLDLFTTLLARVSTAQNLPGIIAFVTGTVSAYSSSSGVVMPTFVKQIDVAGGLATGVLLEDGARLRADAIVANADLPYVYDRLLPERAAAERLERLNYTCSAIMFYWGTNKLYPQLGTHNVFLCGDYRASFERIFRDRTLPDEPSFYVHAPARIDTTAAPVGGDSVMVLVPVGHLDKSVGQDWDTLRARARAAVLRRLATIGITDLEEHLKFEVSYTARDWRMRYSLAKGAAFGLSHTFRQVGYLRPQNRHRRYHNLYFVGSSTHPGTGLPMVLLSARLTTERILKEIGTPQPAVIAHPIATV